MFVLIFAFGCFHIFFFGCLGKMSRLGEMLAMGLQERAGRARGATTILELLRDSMDGVDGMGRRKSLQERLGLKGFGCCGATWGIGRPSTSVREDQDEQGPLQIDAPDVGQPQTPPENASAQDCVGQTPAASAGMNLAAALAAERHFRAAQDSDGTAEIEPSNGTAPGTPFRMSLMRLLEESDGVDGDAEMETKEREKEERGMGSDSMCCVCMVRKKGAAFIPCGHTFCRVCSRELWLNRGSCPLCNRLILEILDIF